jgi:hypothetical protein
MYKAILFTTDGSDYVTDYSGCNTIEEVEELLANQGSRWYFYPWEFVIKDRGYIKPRQRIVSVPMWPQEMIELNGKSISTVQRYLKEHGNRIAEAIL